MLLLASAAFGFPQPRLEEYDTYTSEDPSKTINIPSLTLVDYGSSGNYDSHIILKKLLHYFKALKMP